MNSLLSPSCVIRPLRGPAPKATSSRLLCDPHGREEALRYE
ncbi:hypothetical protein GETHPA_03330 [Geothrix rubra]|uniref:Uncharacterized protein n=1 Tax=Geothrix rubra TaxID=2927977 RepID=A0ABQ5Q230_9BACT|nr:hypothetical protein GETHPA_03330 [Geothrix rubra]